MRKLIFIPLLLLSVLCSGQNIAVRGVVKSSAGEPVPYATVIDSVHNTGVVANANGFFSISLVPGQTVLQATHVSYAKQSQTIYARTDTFLVFTLANLEIGEVLVKGTPLNRQAMLGMHFLESRTIQNIPTFFGEQDIMKAMTVLPGIAGGIDMYSSIYVRGGNRDQNLFLLDGARVYTTSVGGGYSSIFNPDIIAHVDIYKGGAPAKYGDGVSSVIDIALIDGKGKPEARIDIGTLRSGFMLKGLGSDKFGYYLTGRMSNLDVVSGTLSEHIRMKRQPKDNYELYRFQFWDIDGKFTWTPTQRTTVSACFHLSDDIDGSVNHRKNPIGGSGSDYFDYKVEWGNYRTNNVLSLNVRHVFSSGISFINTTSRNYYSFARKSEYLSTNPDDMYHRLYEMGTFLTDFTNKAEVAIPVNNRHTVTMGTQYSDYRVSPEYQVWNDKLNKIDSTKNAAEHELKLMAFYTGNTFKISDKTSLRAGLRYNHFVSTDTIFRKLEPRLSLSVELSPKWTYMGGFSITGQPFHVIAKMRGDGEDESWMLANKNLDMQQAWQFSSGLFGSIPGTAIELSIEGFYKNMSGLNMYAPGAYNEVSKLDHIFNNGLGRSYGSEFLLQKTQGRLQWSLAYTLSWSHRQFVSINNGLWFNSEFDRRHDLNANLSYSWKEKNIFNANYMYQSGRPFTMPVAYVAQTPFFNDFYVINQVNNARTPAYRRFDVSYRRIGEVFWGRKFECNFTIMNLFANSNPAAVYINDGELEMLSMYIVIPSVQLKLNLFKN